MQKDVFKVGAFLVFVFAVTFAAHLLYVKGYAFDMAKDAAHHGGTVENALTVYKTESDCEHATGAKCYLQICDNVPAGKNFEDICGQGFKKGWQPEGEQSGKSDDDHDAPDNRH